MAVCGLVSAVGCDTDSERRRGLKVKFKVSDWTESLALAEGSRTLSISD